MKAPSSIIRSLLVGGAATAATLAVAVPSALAVGWLTIGPAQVLLGPASGVSTAPYIVYSSDRRLYQTQPVPSDAPTLTQQYNYTDGTLYARGFVNWNDGTPVYWDVNGGNKTATCANQSTTKDAERTITCQYYSTT
jgi:hypothetical protein